MRAYVKGKVFRNKDMSRGVEANPRFVTLKTPSIYALDTYSMVMHYWLNREQTRELRLPPSPPPPT